ncbi:hypothetical protein [Fibrobacter sp. UWB12]|uniref:hypothetical protein n=1 Tax=Fibrobacter sp. UWB12 TaxID=1896203 RepID=UPI00091B6C45|nr:hypothetical protein [Fibrobacter sp. UWB12]SHK53902.1 hypothetical protein SAMN05720759_103329 [Fibrobacter sp. UWB12]
MKRMILPLGVLLFVIACGDDSSSANYQWAENCSSSSEDVQESSSSRNDVSSSSSSRKDISSSSHNVILSSSEGSRSSSSCHSGPDLESSSSMDSISSSSFQNDKSSSSAISSSSLIASSSSSSRNDLSSSSHNVILSSSEGSSSSSSCHSRPDPESSSSMDSISSSSFQNDKSSSSAISSSSWIASSSSSSRNDVSSSSSEIPTDPSKIFEMRVPKRDAYTCEERGDWGDGVFTETYSQNDFVCTYDYDGEKGFLYVQLSPTSCSFGFSLTPNYDVDKAELYVDGKFVDISDVKYEWGGNHHVQKLWFTYKGKVFRYGQSSLGWGGRPCQGMDCLNVFESDKKTYVVNGCDEQRSIPIVCRGVNAENPVFDFTDTFKVCDGDSRN